MKLDVSTTQLLDVHEPAARDRQRDDEIAVRRVVVVQLASRVARGVRHLDRPDDEPAKAGRGQVQDVLCENFEIMQ